MLSDMFILVIKSRKIFCTGSQNRKIDFLWEVGETTKKKTLDVQMIIESWSCSTIIYRELQDRVITALKKLFEITRWMKKSWTNAKRHICWSTQEEEVLFYSSLISNISKMSDKSELRKFTNDEENPFKLSAFTPTKEFSINHSNSKIARINFTLCLWNYLDKKILTSCMVHASLFEYVFYTFKDFYNNKLNKIWQKLSCHKDKEETTWLNNLTLKIQCTSLQS